MWLTPLKVVQPQPGDDPQQLAAEAREIVGEALGEMRSAPYTAARHAQASVTLRSVTYATGRRSNWQVAVS
ncbi:MAG: hypothetical protein V9H69_19695 [Anaerolineae bacterium]